MKTYRWQSENEGIERFLSGKHDFVEWFKRNFEICMFYISQLADRDNIKSEIINYEFEFRHQRWDIDFVIIGKAHT